MLVVAGASPAPSMSALVGAVEVPTQGCLCIVSYLCVALLECSACNMSFHVLYNTIKLTLLTVGWLTTTGCCITTVWWVLSAGLGGGLYGLVAISISLSQTSVLLHDTKEVG